MAMRLFFVRHGERSDEGDDPPLTPAGEAMSRESGAWLARYGAVPRVIVQTRTLRTAQTGIELMAGWAAVSGVTSAATVVSRAGLPNAPKGWGALTNELHAAGFFGDVVLVGHHGTQSFVETLAGAWPLRAPKANRAAVYVVEVVEQEWRVTGNWAGGVCGPTP